MGPQDKAGENVGNEDEVQEVVCYLYWPKLLPRRRFARKISGNRDRRTVHRFGRGAMESWIPGLYSWRKGVKRQLRARRDKQEKKRVADELSNVKGGRPGGCCMVDFSHRSWTMGGQESMGRSEEAMDV